MKSVSRKFDWVRMPRLSDLGELLEALEEHLPARSCHRFIWVLIDSGLNFNFEYTVERLEKICKSAATAKASFFEKRCNEAERKEIIEEILADERIFKAKEAGIFGFIPAEFAEEDSKKYCEKVDKFNAKRREQRVEEKEAPAEKNEEKKEPEKKRVDYGSAKEVCESVTKFSVLAGAERISKSEVQKRLKTFGTQKQKDKATYEAFQSGAIQAAKNLKKKGDHDGSIVACLATIENAFCPTAYREKMAELTETYDAESVSSCIGDIKELLKTEKAPVLVAAYLKDWGRRHGRDDRSLAGILYDAF